MQLATSELDEALSRAGLAASLRDALEQIDGPIRDVVGEREERAAAWDRVFDAPRDSRLAAVTALPIDRGTVKRLAGGDPRVASRLLDDAQKVLRHLPVSGIPLARLAVQALGDSHALDKGCAVATLVLAAIRKDAVEDARDAWARVGVMVSEYSRPVLLFNVPVVAESPCQDLLMAAAELEEPLHLSLRMLLRQVPRWRVHGKRVFVTENPTVVGMAADNLGRRCPPMVCTDGVPAASQQTLLLQLAHAGADLRYHGDFDWPGIAIANFVMRTYGATPWRFSATDFTPENGFPLEGVPIIAEWDRELTAKMEAARKGLHEEAVIDRLIEDLSIP
jgi:uncharacterized protein (TIGR02679 family)